MLVELFDFKEFIDLNDLKPVSSPIVFGRGGVPDPDGLLSDIIFGIDTKSRKNTFSYIELHGHFFHPHVYKSMKRLYRNIERIISGSEYYKITPEGALEKDDEHGQTGIEFIYKNWEKIDWTLKQTDEETASMRNERINLLTKTPKNQIFVSKMIVIPVFYRDISAGSQSGGGQTDSLNNLYTKLIRLASLLKDRDMFDFTLHSNYYMMQNLLVEIYDTFKHKLEKKNGMIRKYLMGKNVDNCVRSVISCPLYHGDTPESSSTRFGVAGIPVAQICDLDAPFMMNWLRSFFDRLFITNKEQVPSLVTDPKTGKKSIEFITVYKPELFFTDKYLNDMMERYMADPEYRFDPIEVPVDKGVTRPIMFAGKRLDPSGTHEISNLSTRPMTITDVLYMAAYDVTKNQHALITRYPVSDAYGLFVAEVSPIATLDTEVVHFNGKVYTNYPKIDLDCPRHKIGIRFVDTIQFSNSYLDGLGGD